MKNYITTPPAHLPLMAWGNAGAKSDTYSLKAKYGFENYILVTVKQLKLFSDYYVSISDRGNARFSKTAAEDCVKYVRNRIRQNAYASMVPALSKKWADRKKALGLSYQVGMATEHMLKNITSFRTNLSGHAFKETKHTGYVVGINQKADFSIDPEKVTNLSNRTLSKARKLRKTKKDKYNRFSSEFLNAKLYWLEHGKTGRGYRGATYRQPPRPIFTKAIEEFVKYKFSKVGGKDFIGQLKVNSSGYLEFKFKAHK